MATEPTMAATLAPPVHTTCTPPTGRLLHRHPRHPLAVDARPQAAVSRVGTCRLPWLRLRMGRRPRKSPPTARCTPCGLVGLPSSALVPPVRQGASTLPTGLLWPGIVPMKTTSPSSLPKSQRRSSYSRHPPSACVCCQLRGLAGRLTGRCVVLRVCPLSQLPLPRRKFDGACVLDAGHQLRERGFGQ